MKKILVIVFAIVMMLSSCNNGKLSAMHADETASIDSSEIEARARDSIFQSRGDTIFGNVLYGMNKQETKASIKQFQENLKHPLLKTGFVFAGHWFMDIDIYNRDVNDDILIDYYIGNHDGAELWKGKLSAVTWSSEYLYGKIPREVEETLNKFVELFEKRFGKPNSKKTAEHDWIYFSTYSEPYRFYYLDPQIATWDSKERMVIIFMEGKNPPTYYNGKYISQTGHEGLPFKYKLKVSFFDKTFLEEISSAGKKLKKQKEQEALDKQREDSLRYINSL